MEAQHDQFKFDGSAWGLIGTTFIVTILGALTLGIASPWLWCWQMRWFVGHMVIGGRRLQFEGTGWNYFGTSLLVTVLCIITFGLYLPWGIVRIWKWTVANTTFSETGTFVQ
jgi:uncharacterized membrane protein YjgN (DUF898 family)